MEPTFLTFIASSGVHPDELLACANPVAGSRANKNRVIDNHDKWGLLIAGLLASN
jgi:hypothetical protein